SPAADLTAKIGAAIERHASAVIVVNPPGADDPKAAALSDTQSTRGKALPVPVVMMQPAQAARLMKAADPTDMPRSLMDFRKGADVRGGVIDLPNATVTIETALARDPITTDNVGAVLPG